MTESDRGGDNGSGKLGKHSRICLIEPFLFSIIMRVFTGDSADRAVVSERIKKWLVGLLRAATLWDWEFVWMSYFHEFFYSQIG